MEWGASGLRLMMSGIWLDALPEVFSGLRVAQISDIHHGLSCQREWLAEAGAPDRIASDADHRLRADRRLRHLFREKY